MNPLKGILQISGDALWTLIVLAAAIVVGLTADAIFFAIARFLANRTKSTLSQSLVKHCRALSRLIVPLMAIQIALPLVRVPSGVREFFGQAFSILLIVSVAWLIVKLTHVVEDVILARYRIDVRDNLQARRIYTQFEILRKIVTTIVAVLALATVLMTFDKVRQLGTSILASAGIAGIIVGFAAQRSIATFVAGFQIALTGPIRIDDIVIVENESGHIEEITLTYVVVRLWDLRRLIVPITYFLEKPFQNWTRISADLLGTAFLYVDYTVPVQAVREEFRRILESSSEWDRKVCELQVTDSKEHTVELRALMSAADSTAIWDLRCMVRERLIDFIKKNYPGSLPKIRAEISEANSGTRAET